VKEGASRFRFFFQGKIKLKPAPRLPSQAENLKAPRPKGASEFSARAFFPEYLKKRGVFSGKLGRTVSGKIVSRILNSGKMVSGI